jgi:hypothetical protein
METCVLIWNKIDENKIFQKYLLHIIIIFIFSEII